MKLDLKHADLPLFASGCPKISLSSDRSTDSLFEGDSLIGKWQCCSASADFWSLRTKTRKHEHGCRTFSRHLKSWKQSYGDTLSFCVSVPFNPKRMTFSKIVAPDTITKNIFGLFP